MTRSTVHKIYHNHRSWESLFSTVTQWLAMNWMIWGSNPGRKQEIFLLSRTSRPALGITQPSFWYIQGILSLGVKHRRCEVDHSPPSNAEVKNDRSHNSTPPRCLNYMWQDNFTFYHKYFCQVNKISTDVTSMWFTNSRKLESFI